MKKIFKYFINIIIWVDVGCNVILFAGSPKETISSRVGRNTSLEGWRGHLCTIAETVIDFFLGFGHCKKNIQKAEDWIDEV